MKKYPLDIDHGEEWKAVRRKTIIKPKPCLLSNSTHCHNYLRHNRCNQNSLVRKTVHTREHNLTMSLSISSLYLFIFLSSAILWPIDASKLKQASFQEQLSLMLSDKHQDSGRQRPERSLSRDEQDLALDRVLRSPQDTESSIYPDPTQPEFPHTPTLYGSGEDVADEDFDYSPFDLNSSFIHIFSKLYEGPVCTLVDVRNTPDDLKDLENCTIVNGFVRIVFMHNAKEKDFEKYTFPKLRVITEYLLIYRVYGLRSLRRMFPNLAVIQGRRVFYKYGLVIYENPQLQELGLPSLQHINRGGVRIQKNSKLCYLDTIDWARLGRLGEKMVNEDMMSPIFKDNTLPGDCLNQCGEENECMSSGSDGYLPNCWGLKICQKPSCPLECPNACMEGECKCHEECLAGCTTPNNASACFSCLHSYDEGKCVAKCPPGTYLKNDWRCVTREWCYELNWLRYEDKCQKYCPIDWDYKEDIDGTLHCVFCGDNCTKRCDFRPEYVVNDLDTLQELNECKVIQGRLVINVVGGADFLRELENVLQGVEEVDALVIRRSESLVSLSFLKNLKRITGAKHALKDETYSLYVLDNQNLRELFPTANKSESNNESPGHQLKIEGGKAFFHFNPRLCIKEIEKVSSLTALEEDDKDISEITNGDRATCDMMPLLIDSIEHMPISDGNYATVRIRWINVKISDPRTLIGYQVFYKESKFTNATLFEGIYECGKSSSWYIMDKLVNPNEAFSSNVSSTTIALLHDLKPYTQYAIYVRTYTTSTAKKGAQSNITYFMTEPSKPTEPVDLKARALNTTSIRVSWHVPILPNGIITHYAVRWRRQKEDMQLIRSVNMCGTSTRFTGGSSFPTTKTPSPFDIPEIVPTESSKTQPNEKCCSCDGKKILPKHEEEATNNLNFENFLHKTILQIRYFPSFDDAFSGSYETRKRRSLDGRAPLLTRERRDSPFATVNITVNSTDGTSLNDLSSITTPGYSTTLPPVTDNSVPYTTAEVEDLDYEWRMATVNTTSITLEELHHFSEYEIQVYACNHASLQGPDDMANNIRPVGCSIESLTSARTRPLLSADVVPADSLISTDVRMRTKAGAEFKHPVFKWESPPDPNGYIKYYKIEMQRMEEEVYREAEDECVSIGKFEKDNGTYVIPFSKAPAKYRGRVMPVSLAGKGDWSKYVTFTIVDRSPAPKTREEEKIWILAIVGGITCVTLTIVFVWCYCRKRKADSKNAMMYSSANPEYVSLAANYVPDGYEVNEDDVEFLREIGRGNFGKVFVGYAKKVIKGEDRTQVAIKKLHERSGIYKRIEFLQEASLMKAFNSTHVVRLLGVVSQTPDPLVIMEYMEKGDLKSFLRSKREDADVPNDKRLPAPTLQEKLQMVAEIADGMAYLAAIKYVHRDLAARNCLVDTNNTVKIGDFGLTRDIYETDYYKKGSRGLLPIRWMAPESLKDGRFDSQSDVWSYGVVIWEVATLAEQPYQGLPHDQVTRFVIDGGYMEKPNNCPKKLYDLMLNCWQFNSKMRPTFNEILTQLSGDVSDRFREESYYFKRRNLYPEEFQTDEETALLNSMGRGDGSYRGFGTPINMTPSRSRCETPCSCHTPASRNSNASSKIIMMNGADYPMSSAEQHQTTTDTPTVPALTSNGFVHSLSMDGIVTRRGSSFLRRLENSIKGSRDGSPHLKKSSPKSINRCGDDFYYSVSTSGLGTDIDGDDDDSSVESGNFAVPKQLNLPQNHNADTSAEIVKEKDKVTQTTDTDTPTPDNDNSYASLSTPSTTERSVRRSPSQFSTGREKSDSILLEPNTNRQASYDKPYAHMNGFVKRNNSHTLRQSPRRESSKKLPCPDESTYVESSPQVNSKYFESNSGSNHFSPSLRASLRARPPSPPATPPPLPPISRDLVLT